VADENKEQLAAMLKSIPLFWRIIIGLIVACAPGGWIYSRFATVSYVEEKVRDHDLAPLDPVIGLPPHPRYKDAVTDLEAKHADDAARLTELERMVRAANRWRVGYAAVDAERDPRRRADAAKSARDTYDSETEFWPCPKDAHRAEGCTDPETAVQKVLRAPRPPR
jgi:hypothetical protein